MIYFVGSGPGALDLLTVRAYKLLQNADIVIWAKSLVNEKLLSLCKASCIFYSSAGLSLEEICRIMQKSHNENKLCLRLVCGDPSLYGAVKEQMRFLQENDIKYEMVPGVSSMFAASSSLNVEYTVPNLSQSVIITRIAGRTPVGKGDDLTQLASHGSCMIIFLSVDKIEQVVSKLLAGKSYTLQTKVAVVQRASWEDEKCVIGTLRDICQKVKASNINKTALILVGDFLNDIDSTSLLYDKDFATGYRKVVQQLKPPLDLRIASFTQRGRKVAQELCARVKDDSSSTQVGVQTIFDNTQSLDSWVKKAYVDNEKSHNVVLLFIAALGIAVRSIAPYLQHKGEDCAVLVMDCNANNIISLVGGHSSSANDYTRYLAQLTGATPIITTATDIMGAWAVDSWAKEHNIIIQNPAFIKQISKDFIEKKTVQFLGKNILTPALQASLPACDNVQEMQATNTVEFSYKVVALSQKNLLLTPKVLALGIGCKKDTKSACLKDFIIDSFSQWNLSINAIAIVASIDKKACEKAILDFSKMQGVDFVTFSAEDLDKLPGDFPESDFVRKKVGTGSVACRSAVSSLKILAKDSEFSPRIIIKKHSGYGITLAVACAIYDTDSNGSFP